MPTIALKIDVNSYRGTREGVPNLVRILKKYQFGASFLFSLGKDHTGWAIRRAFTPGFYKKVSRTSALEHYGAKAFMYGLILPAPDIGSLCVEEMRATKRAGFECGIHSWDHMLWHNSVKKRNANWTLHQMQMAQQRFQDIFGAAPKTYGAAGWQMNEYAFSQLDAYQIAYASDTRAMLNEDGSLKNKKAGPYRLENNNKVYNCIQIPTTLPTIDELLGREINGILLTQENIAAHILNLTTDTRNHVFTLQAELEGQKLAPILIELLEGWLDQGYQCISMSQYYAQLQSQTLPTFPVAWGEIPGRSGELLVLNP